MRPEEIDSFNDAVMIRCWKSHRHWLAKIAADKGLSLPEFMRGQFVKIIKAEYPNENISFSPADFAVGADDVL